jgi:hypothetical protein
MVIIRFASTEMRRRGLAYLLGRFSGRSWVTGEVMVPEPALPHMAAEGLTFTVEGPATYDRIFRLNEGLTGPGSDNRAAGSQ